MFSWAASVQDGQLPVLVPGRLHEVFSPRSNTGMLIAGPPGSGVTDTLGCLLTGARRESPKGTVQEVWIDFRNAAEIASHTGLLTYLSKQLRLPEVWNLRSLLNALAARSRDEGGAPYAVVLDHVELLPPKEQMWLLRSLARLQRLAGTAIEPGFSDAFLLVGGAVTGEAAIVGDDEQIACIAHHPPNVSHANLSDLHRVLTRQLATRRVSVDDGVVDWLHDNLRGDAIAVEVFYQQLFDATIVGTSEVTVAHAARILEETDALAERLKPPPTLALEFLDVLAAAFALLPIGERSTGELRAQSPRLRALLYRLGFIQVVNGHLEIRGPAVVNAIDYFVRTPLRGAWAELLAVAEFLSDSTGLTMSSLATAESGGAVAIVQQILSSQVAGDLLFYYYATVDRIEGSRLFLTAVRPDGSECVVTIGLSDGRETLLVGTPLIYYATRESHGGRSARLVPLTQVSAES